ncbi:MAG: hypothetical protein JKY93_10365 [Gammaproteobacteria bacterium]|nr:hypothetical protein [Gammaproteobacteria bacterium]
MTDQRYKKKRVKRILRYGIPPSLEINDLKELEKAPIENSNNVSFVSASTTANMIGIKGIQPL